MIWYVRYGPVSPGKIKHFVKNLRLWETGSYVTCQNITSFIQDERLSIYICTNKFYTIKCPNIFVEEKLIQMNVRINICDQNIWIFEYLNTTLNYSLNMKGSLNSNAWCINWENYKVLVLHKIYNWVNACFCTPLTTLSEPRVKSARLGDEVAILTWAL